MPIVIIRIVPAVCTWILWPKDVTTINALVKWTFHRVAKN